jgi:hypothetical protein
MDTGEQVSLNPRPLAPRTIGLSAVVAIAVSALLAAWGTFGDEDSSTGDYVFVLVIIGVLAAIVYGFVVPRAARGIWPMARTGLILSILGLLAVIVFWSGAPPIFAFAGLLLGYFGREREPSALATGRSCSASWRSSRTSRSISQTRLRKLRRWPPGHASSA